MKLVRVSDTRGFDVGKLIEWIDCAEYLHLIFKHNTADLKGEARDAMLNWLRANSIDATIDTFEITNEELVALDNLPIEPIPDGEMCAECGAKAKYRDPQNKWYYCEKCWIQF